MKPAAVAAKGSYLVPDGHHSNSHAHFIQCQSNIFSANGWKLKWKNECQTLQNTISAFLSFYVCCSNIYTSKERLVLGLRYNLSCCGMTNISSIVSSILPNIQLSLSESHCLALKALYFQHRLPKKDITKTVIWAALCVFPGTCAFIT